MANKRIWSVAGLSLLLSVAVIGALLFMSDLRHLSEVLRRLDGWFLALAIAVSALSYMFNYLAFRGLTRAVDCAVGGWKLFLIAFASATVSSVLSAGGFSGMGVRLFFLRRQGLRTHATLIVSVVSTMLNNIVLLLFVVAGFGRLLVNGTLGPLEKILSFGIVSVSGLLVVAAMIGLYNRAVLDLVLSVVILIALRVAGAFPRLPVLREVTPERMQRFREEFHSATALITSRKRKIAIPFAWLLCEWAAAAGVLYCCFLATGYVIAPGALAAGFAVGVFVYLISLVPGGLGIMEASMAGVYVSLGVPLEESIVALLAYRIFFYFLPFGLSLILCGPLLREVSRVTVEGGTASSRDVDRTESLR